MFVILGKLEISQYTFTAIANTENEVSSAILKAWIKYCTVEKKAPYGKNFESEVALKNSIHYLTMDLGIAYRLYNKVEAMKKDVIKGNLTPPVSDKAKPEKPMKEIRKQIRKQVKKQIVDQLIDQLVEIRKN